MFKASCWHICIYKAEIKDLIYFIMACGPFDLVNNLEAFSEEILYKILAYTIFSVNTYLNTSIFTYRVDKSSS